MVQVVRGILHDRAVASLSRSLVLVTVLIVSQQGVRLIVTVVTGRAVRGFLAEGGRQELHLEPLGSLMRVLL